MSGILVAFSAAKTAIATAVDEFFNRTTLLLPGNGTNGAQNNTFLDSSTNNFTITRNGNTTQGTFSPFSQTGWSNYFNGSADYLGVGANSAFDFGTGNFTVECWFYYASTPPAGSGYDYLWGIGTSASSGIGLYIEGGVPKIWNGSAVLTTSGSISAGTWYHIAVVRNGSGTNNLTVYLNGSSIGSATVTSNLTGGGTSGMNIARWALASDANYFGGYISNLRITKSGALYTGSFTPSTTPLTTTVSAGTVSLLTCQSNRFIDNSTNAFAITVNGSPSVQAFSPFAPQYQYTTPVIGGSGYFDGTGDYLSGSATTVANFGTSAYTFEFWIYNDASGTNYQPVFQSNAFAIYVRSNQVSLWSAGTPLYVSTTALIPNAWNHVALIRTSTAANGTVWYVNGAALTAGTDATNWGGNAFTVGYDTTPRYLTGYLSNLRITKNQALASGSFTPPTAPLTSTSIGWTGANVAGSLTGTVSLLLNFTNGGIIDATGKNVLETVGNAQISTTQSKWGGSSIYLDGNGDYLKRPSSQLFVFPGDFTIEFWAWKSASGLNNYDTPVSCDNDGNATNGWALELGTVRYLYFVANAGAFTLASSTINPNDSTWHHYAVTRSGSTVRLFRDGTQIGSGTYSATIGNSSIPELKVGAYGSATTNAFNGYIDDLRITNGYARYTGAFTPPAAAFSLQ